MAQKVNIAYRDRAKSEVLNQRFKDIIGPAVLKGYRFALGTGNHTLSLVRNEHPSSIAFTPSGVKIEETTDLMDIVSLEPNVNTTGLPRVDSIYLVYKFGPESTGASYTVVKGTDVAAENPNPYTHLLLGYVNVRPNSYPLQSSDLNPVPFGFAELTVAGDAKFNGSATFEEPVTFNGPVQFMDGTTGGGGGTVTGESSTIQRLPSPIIAEPGQTTFTLPSAYSMGSNSLFVYKNGEQVSPDQFHEVDVETFRFHDPLIGGEEIWAYWFQGVSLFTQSEHEHDDLYYRKWEVENRMITSITDYFNGSIGRTVTHNLGHTNYSIISVIATDKTDNVGSISVNKLADTIIVYNSGTYRGRFEISYVLDTPFQYTPTNEELGFLNSEAKERDTETSIYKVVEHKRQNGTIYLKTTLSNRNSDNRYTRVKLEYYNTSGTMVVRTETFAITYDVYGQIISKIKV